MEGEENDVKKANNDYIRWKQLRDRGLVPDIEENERTLFKNLKKAEDDLARAKFGDAIKKELIRIDVVVEDELERIDGLSFSSSGDTNNMRCAVIDTNKQSCGGCGGDLSNHLALVKKHGVGKTQHALSYCCGKRICYQCWIIKDPGTNKCQACGGIPLSSEKEIAKALEKFAMQGIPWAMGNLALAFATGKHGIKKNPKKAKKWLVRAADANDSQSQYHLGECYYIRATGIDPLMCWGSFTLSLKDAYKLHLLAADKGLSASYHRLADMYRTGKFVEKNSDEAFRYESLAVYQQEKQLQGQDCFEMFRYYGCGSEGCGSEFGKGVGHKEKEDTNLALYWCGKMAEILNESKQPIGFPSMLALGVDAKDYWYKHTEGIGYPGYSVLPLVKRLRDKHNMDPSGCPFLVHWTTRCANEHCRKEAGDVVNLKVCSGCQVFFFCSRACQLVHWKLGHKRECKGKHWIQDFLPKL